MSKTVLVIEDDPDLCELLEYHLSRNGYRVSVWRSLQNGIEKLNEIRPDLILLDVMLPDGDGFDFCRRLRDSVAWSQVPVLFLTARDGEVDRVLGLEIGGDDYITKPFSPRELMARVKAHLRRKAAPEAGTKPAPLHLDPKARQAYVNGRHVPLTATEYRLLEFLMANPGKVFSREELLKSIWGEGWHVSPRNVDVHIRRLRESIEPAPQDPQWIQTVRGFGYRFEAPA